MKKRYILIPVVIGFVAVGSYFAFGDKKQNIETTDVKREDLVRSVSVTGELRSDVELNLNFEVAGRVSEVKVKKGDKVAAGDVLAVVDGQGLSEKLDSAEAALDQAKAQAGINDDEIARLQKLSDDAKDYLDDTEDLEDQKVDAAKQSRDDAQDKYEDAQDYYNKVIQDEGSANTANSLSAKLTLDTALASYNAAKDAYETAQKYQDMSVRSAENSYNSAKENLDKAKSDNQKSYYDAGVASAQAAYDIAKLEYEKTFLKAPVGGEIVAVNYDEGEIIGTASVTGTTSISGTAVIQMITSDFLVEADVAESDIAEIGLGDRAEATFDSLSEDDKFELEVVSIDPAATVIQDVVYYRVKFKLDGSIDPRLKQGMTVNVDVVTNEKNSVLAIPERLVQEDDNGSKYVEIITNGNRQKVDITTGLRADEGLIEVTSGLSEGDKVVSNVIK